MEATKQYQFTSLFCMLIATSFTIVGMVLCIINATENGYVLGILVLPVLTFFGVIGQSQMITTFGKHLKGN